MVSIVKPRIEYNSVKNLLLKASRGVDFDDVISAIQKEDVIDDIPNYNKRYSRQRILVINIKGYAYGVPYVHDKERDVIFLKTIYPSRALTKRYLHEKETNI